MSLINKMLQDLDQRGSGPSGSLASSVKLAPQTDRRISWPLLIGVIAAAALAAVAGALLWRSYKVMQAVPTVSVAKVSQTPPARPATPAASLAPPTVDATGSPIVPAATSAPSADATAAKLAAASSPAASLLAASSPAPGSATAASAMQDAPAVKPDSASAGAGDATPIAKPTTGPEKSSATAKAGAVAKAGKDDKAGKEDKAGKDDIAGKDARADKDAKSDKADKDARVGKDAKAGKDDRAAKNAKAGKDTKAGKDSKAAKAAKASKSAKSAPAPSAGLELNKTQQAEAQYRKGLASLQDGRNGEAIAALEQAVRIDPTHEAARQTVVGLLIEARRSDEALRHLQLGLTLEPRQPAMAMLLARLQIERGASGIETLMRTLPYATGNADYHALLAGALARETRHQEAAEHYRLALRGAPQNGTWLIGLGISLQTEKRDAEALDAFKRAKASGSLTPELLTYAERRINALSR